MWCWQRYMILVQWVHMNPSVELQSKEAKGQKENCNKTRNWFGWHQMIWFSMMDIYCKNLGRDKKVICYFFLFWICISILVRKHMGFSRLTSGICLINLATLFHLRILFYSSIPWIKVQFSYALNTGFVTILELFSRTILDFRAKWSK